MRKWAFLLIVLSFGLIQVTLLNHLKIFSVKPDLLLICLVFANIAFDFKWIFIFCVLAGALKDILGLMPFGINTVIFALWGFLLFKLSRKITVDNTFIYTALIFIISIINAFVLRATLIFLGHPIVSLGIFFKITALESLYTAALTPLVFKAINKLLVKDN